MDRLEIIQKLRDNKWTFQQIGNYLSLSRQRVYQILFPKKFTKLSAIQFSEEYNSEGIIKETGRDFIREVIRKRDNHTCQICNKIWKIGQRRFDVHHIDCKKEKTKQYDNWEKEKNNMITLCHKCHINLEEHRQTKVNTWKKKEKNYNLPKNLSPT